MTTRRAALAALVAGGLSLGTGAQGRDRIARVGFLARLDDGAWLKAALAALGYVEGANYRLVMRHAEDAATQAAAAALVRDNVDALFAFGNARILHLRRYTRTIPIVCGEVSDAVALGLAKTLARPGGNVTGISYEVRDTSRGAILMVRRVLPRVRRIVAVVVRGREGMLREGMQVFAEEAAREGISWEFATLGPLAEYENAFAGIREPQEVLAWLTSVPTEPGAGAVATFFRNARIATMGGAGDDWVRAGALMSFIRTLADRDRRIAAILDKVLRGTSPGDIPFEVPDRVEFTFNRATARLLGLQVSPEIAVRVTEWIE